MYNTNFVSNNVISFEDFQRYAPPNSVAFDGFVGAENGAVNGYLNHNHHENSGPETRSACWQIYHAIKDGTLEKRIDTSGPWYGFLNHLDGDSVLSNYLLAHKDDEFSESEKELLEELVSIEDRLDVNAGLYSVEPELMRKIAWVFRPCNGCRNVSISEKKALEIIGEVDRRISEYLEGNGKKVELKTGYDVLLDRGDWKIIQEYGEDSRSALAREGITSFVSVKGRDDGNLACSLINMDAGELYGILNKHEGIAEDDPDRWGGADNRGGSPRGKGSKLSVYELQDIISSYREGTGWE